MTRIALVIGLGLFGLPLAATAKKQAAGPAMQGIKTEDCAKFFHSKAPLPQKMSEIQDQLAQNLEMHIKGQSTATDRASRAEVAFIRKLAQEHRALSASLKRLAAMMASANFPPAPHDMSRMDAKAGEGMAKQAALEREFVELLTKEVVQTEKMLSAMKGMPREEMVNMRR